MCLGDGQCTEYIHILYCIQWRERQLPRDNGQETIAKRQLPRHNCQETIAVNSGDTIDVQVLFIVEES